MLKISLKRLFHIPTRNTSVEFTMLRSYFKPRLFKNHKTVLFSVSCNELLPSFSWEKVSSRQAIPLLRITFPDGSDDYAVLKAFNPIPLGRDEREEDVDKCIFDGYLMNEKDVHVTLAGCVNSDSFQVNTNTNTETTESKFCEQVVRREKLCKVCSLN